MKQVSNPDPVSCLILNTVCTSIAYILQKTN